MKRKKKEVLVQARLSQEHYRKLVGYAKAQGISVAACVRRFVMFNIPTVQNDNA